MQDGKRAARILVLATALLLWLPAFAFAYHGVGDPGDIGGGQCELCHLKGVSATGSRGAHATTAPPGGSRCNSCHWTVHDAVGGKLLFRTTVTDTCRACHDGTGGQGIYQLTSFGITPGSAHRVETTTIVPGGSEFGGSASRTFEGSLGRMGCSDCHSAHGTSTVAPFTSSRSRFWSPLGRQTDALLRQRPAGADTTVTQYGADWCMACHRGRGSGGAVHNHPVDSRLQRPDPYVYERVPVGTNDWMVPMASSADGTRIFVADTGNWRIQRFTAAGAYVGSSQLASPSAVGGLCLTSDYNGGGRDIAVADGGDGQTTQRILDVNTGAKIADWNEVMAPLSVEQPPHGLTDIPTGGALAIMRFDGKIRDINSGQMREYPAFSNPMGLVADAAGSYWVVDAGNSQVGYVNFGDATAVPRYVTPVGQLSGPMAISRDTTSGRLYVADTGNDRIRVYNADHSSISLFATWGSHGSGPGQFDRPAGILVAANGDVYVADRGNSRIQRFTATGTYVAEWGTLGTGEGQFGFGRVNLLSVGYSNRGMLMDDPRLARQVGHGPICQQCHSDTRDVGTLVNGVSTPATFTISYNTNWVNYLHFLPNGTEVATGNPDYTAFPHETSADNLLVRTGDGLCLDCHLPANLP